MSGGMFGGDAWTKNHEGILDHARNLRYDDYLAESGGSLPSTDADKATWTSAMDKFNAWKAREVAKQDSGQAWWQTYEAPSEGGSEGGGSGSLTNPGTGIGPYPLSNRYFPQLTNEYEAPHAQDWSQFMQSGSPFSGMGGLLYQPGTQEYMEQFPMPDNLLNYQPPQINRQPVQYMNSLLGPMEVIMPEEEGDKDPDEMTPEEKIASGLFDGVPGYGEGGGYGANPFSGAGKYGPGGMYGHAEVPTGEESEGYGTLGKIAGAIADKFDN